MLSLVDLGRRLRRKQTLVAASVVCLAATLPYLSTLQNYFVADDFGVVQLLSQKPASYFPRWFVSSWMDSIWGFTPDEIRPFPALSYQLTALFGPGSPVANHVVNIAIHAANGLLVLAIARIVAGFGLIASTFAALVFVVLPVHAESVAWITGRVDTLPAFFYLSSFLAFAWWRRAGDRPVGLYVASVALFFGALFSKQTTITMVGALLFYDLLVNRRWLRLSWLSVGVYVPFIVLTAGYLGLRYALFGEVAREGQLNADLLGLFQIFLGKHLQRVMFGAEVGRWPLGYIVAVLVVTVTWLLARSSREQNVPRPRDVVVYFGAVWWVLGVAPIVVAGYESTRHVYLASLGWAILLGLWFELACQARRKAASRSVAVVCGGGLLVSYLFVLQAALFEWNGAAALSRKAVADLEREALRAPAGSLLIVGGPPRSWGWALPFAAQPPFTDTDLTRRVFIVSPKVLSCCRPQWADQTRDAVQTWARNAQAPVIALRWDESTGVVYRLTDGEDPPLRSEVLMLPQTDSPEALDQAMWTILGRARR